jgi:hypothetical protein
LLEVFHQLTEAERITVRMNAFYCAAVTGQSASACELVHSFAFYMSLFAALKCVSACKIQVLGLAIVLEGS